MKQFLLLRSNKQTGPYSAEELQQMGLKSYDLIWVDGKSAAWRYPGEIDELKSFAPPVEEQPYDRFYKKSDAAKQQQSAPEAPPVQAPPATIATEKPAPKKEKEYKRVFVTLPSSASSSTSPAPVQKQSSSSFVEKPAPAPEKKEYQQYLPKEFVPELQPEPAPDPVVKKASPPPVKKQAVAQPVKEAAERTPEQDVYFPRKKTLRISPVALAAIAIGILSLIGLGIWIGLSIDKKDQGVSLVSKSDAVTDNSGQTDNGLIGNTSQTIEPSLIQDSLADNRQTAGLPPQQKRAVRVPEPSNLNVAADSLKRPANAKQTTDSSDVAKEEVRVKKPVAKLPTPDLEKLVSVSSNDYKVGPFGGISKLALTVKNSSEYNINLVVVQVEYLKVNKEVFKTENLYFRDLSANSSLTLDAPRSNRGNTVNYKVTLINSKDHLFHAGN